VVEGWEMAGLVVVVVAGVGQGLEVAAWVVVATGLVVTGLVVVVTGLVVVAMVVGLVVAGVAEAQQAQCSLPRS
jgi:hypothetical protein